MKAEIKETIEKAIEYTFDLGASHRVIDDHISFMYACEPNEREELLDRTRHLLRSMSETIETLETVLTNLQFREKIGLI